MIPDELDVLFNDIIDLTNNNVEIRKKIENYCESKYNQLPTPTSKDIRPEDIKSISDVCEFNDDDGKIVLDDGRYRFLCHMAYVDGTEWGDTLRNIIDFATTDVGGYVGFEDSHIKIVDGLRFVCKYINEWLGVISDDCSKFVTKTHDNTYIEITEKQVVMLCDYLIECYENDITPQKNI